MKTVSVTECDRSAVDLIMITLTTFPVSKSGNSKVATEVWNHWTAPPEAVAK